MIAYEWNAIRLWFSLILVYYGYSLNYAGFDKEDLFDIFSLFWSVLLSIGLIEVNNCENQFWTFNIKWWFLIY